jgi:RNA polymerase sigma-70 factor (ECF subfamily)
MENPREIVELAQNGDKNAFGLLYKEYFQRIYRYCRIQVQRDELAQDICQETFIKAWKALPSFTQTEEGTFQAYLYRIARNLIIDMSRKKKEYKLEDYAEIDTGEDFIEQIEKKDTAAKLKVVLDKLSEIERQIIILRYFEDMSHKECAKILRVKEGALRVRTIRTIKKMKNLLEDE